MLDLYKIRCMLRDRRLDVVGKEICIHRTTLQKIRDGSVNNPKFETIKALSDYFEGGLKNE